jgi:V/A-type H+/Na+-transporting ATPase subunit D
MAANRGILLRLKEQLEFMQKSLDILKMRRDQLASEMSKNLNEVKKRKILEKQLADSYVKIKNAYSILGYSGMSKTTAAINNLKIDIRPVSVMGVTLTDIRIDSRPNLTDISNLVAYDAALNLSKALEELMDVSRKETWIETFAQELMVTNRKVNALEKALIPSLIQRINYVEGKLEEEELEEFFRVKRIKTILRRTQNESA